MAGPSKRSFGVFSAWYATGFLGFEHILQACSMDETDDEAGSKCGWICVGFSRFFGLLVHNLFRGLELLHIMGAEPPLAICGANL